MVEINNQRKAFLDMLAWSDSFGIGLRLFLERFVGRYLQFSQMMSVILRRCRLMPPCLPIALSLFHLQIARIFLCDMSFRHYSND
jgi:hypothetical protein